MITEVRLSRRALKRLQRIPLYIQEKFSAWVRAVNLAGLEKTRQCPGWHDEPLIGDRIGQRSIRLNKQWRAIYCINESGTIVFVNVIEVTPHDY